MYREYSQATPGYIEMRIWVFAHKLVSEVFARHVTVHTRLWLKILLCCFYLFSRQIWAFVGFFFPLATQEEAASKCKVLAECEVLAKINMLVQLLLHKGKAETSSSCEAPFPQAFHSWLCSEVTLGTCTVLCTCSRLAQRCRALTWAATLGLPCMMAFTG